MCIVSISLTINEGGIEKYNRHIFLEKLQILLILLCLPAFCIMLSYTSWINVPSNKEKSNDGSIIRSSVLFGSFQDQFTFLPPKHSTLISAFCEPIYTHFEMAVNKKMTLLSVTFRFCKTIPALPLLPPDESNIFFLKFISRALKLSLSQTKKN